MAEEKLFKLREVAEKLGVATNTVRNAIESGHLIAYLLPGKGRGTYRVTEGAVARYLEDHVYRPTPIVARPVARGRPFRHLKLDD